MNRKNWLAAARHGGDWKKNTGEAMGRTSAEGHRRRRRRRKKKKEEEEK